MKKDAHLALFINTFIYIILTIKNIREKLIFALNVLFLIKI